MEIEDKIISAVHAYEVFVGYNEKFMKMWANLPDDNPFRLKTKGDVISMFDGKRVTISLSMHVDAEFIPIGKVSFSLLGEGEKKIVWSFYLDLAGNMKTAHDPKTIFHNVNHSYRFERVYSIFMAAYLSTLVEAV